MSHALQILHGGFPSVSVLFPGVSVCAVSHALQILHGGAWLELLQLPPLSRGHRSLAEAGGTLFSFFFAKHIIVWRLFRNIHPSLQCSSRSLIHASSYDCYFSTCTSCTVPLSLGHSVHSFCFEALSQLNVSEPQLIFKYHGQWKEGVLAAKRHVCLSLLLLVFLSVERHLCLTLLLLVFLSVERHLCLTLLLLVFLSVERHLCLTLLLLVFLSVERHLCLTLQLLVFLSVERHLCLSLLLSWLTVDASLCKLSLQRVFVALLGSTKIAFSFLELAEQPALGMSTPSVLATWPARCS